MNTLTASRFTHCLALGCTLLLLAQPLQAGLLVYENFDYGSANLASMSGVTSSATGLTGNYATNTVAFSYKKDGLTFSSNFFSTSGGSVNLALATNTYGILGVQLNAGTVTGNLYQSFLFQYSSLTATGSNSGTFSRIAESQTGGTNRFAVAPEGVASGAGPGIGYDGSANMNSAAASLASGTTYLMLAKFTNVGTPLSAGTTGTANLWVFTESAYDSWLSSGGGLESNLSIYASFEAADTAVTSGTYGFDNTDYLHLAGTTTGTGNGVMNVSYDEIRFGTDLASVVPEPSTFALLACGLAGLVAARRRRTK